MRIRQPLKQLCLVALVAMGLPGASLAQDQFPTRDIKIVVTFPPGGGVDVTARYIADHMRKAFGQSVLVDNRPGASAMIGTQFVAKSAPDGYTLLMTAGEIALNPHLYKQQMAYDWEKDLTPISLLVIVPNVLVVNNDVPAKNVRELIAYAKSTRDKLTYSSSGVGNSQQLTGELFNKLAGTTFAHVPYKGAAPQLNDVAGKHITMTFASIGAAQPLIESGKLRPLAVTSLKRVSIMPDVPAIAETLPGFELVNFFSFLGPANLPDPVLRKLNAATGQALRTPDLSAKMKSLGFEPAPSTPEQFRDYIKARSREFEKIIAEANIKLEQ